MRDQARSLLAPERLQQLCRHLAGDGSLDEGAFEWREVDGIMAKVKRNLRPLLRFLSLQGTPANAVLLETLAAMVEAFELGEPLPALEISTALIPARSKRYVLDPAGRIIRDRYEFMVYRLLRDGLEAGDLHCPDSSGFRSFDDDLVDDATFDRRAELLPRHGLEVATRPNREQLEELRDLVETRFESVNLRILAGENAFVRVQEGRTVWERAVHSEEPLPNESFFDMVERVDIYTLLLFVDRRNGFMEVFEHLLGRYRTAADLPSLRHRRGRALEQRRAEVRKRNPHDQRPSTLPCCTCSAIASPHGTARFEARWKRGCTGFAIWGITTRTGQSSRSVAHARG